MAANHGRCAPSYITDDHHSRLLSGGHLHHGLLGETYLLGLVHGFLSLKVTEEIMGAAENQLWHSGICQVVPSEQILAILNQPKLIKYEDSILKKKAKDGTDKPIETAIEEVPKSKRKSRDIEVKEHPSKAKFFEDLEKAAHKREKK
jgi:hypothetical protein